MLLPAVDNSGCMKLAMNIKGTHGASSAIIAFLLREMPDSKQKQTKQHNDIRMQDWQGLCRKYLQACSLVFVRIIWILLSTSIFFTLIPPHLFGACNIASNNQNTSLPFSVCRHWYLWTKGNIGWWTLGILIHLLQNLCVTTAFILIHWWRRYNEGERWLHRYSLVLSKMRQRPQRASLFQGPWIVHSGFQVRAQF